MTVRTHTYYEDGERVLIKEYHYNGIPKCVIPLSNGQKHGISRECYANGNLY